MALPRAVSDQPSRCKSAIRSDHGFMMRSLWHPITGCQRHPITDFHKYFAMTVGERIKEVRAQLGMTRADLSRAADVPYPTLAGIENSDQSTSTRLHALAKALRVRTEWLETGKGPKEAMEVDAGEAGAQALLSAYGAVVLPHVLGYDNEGGPLEMAFPAAAIARLGDVTRSSLGWVINPTDSMGDLVPKGAIAFVDQSDRVVSKNGTYAIRLYDQPSIMRIQLRDGGALRVMGSNRFNDSIDLHGEAVKSLHVGGRVVGFIDQVKLID